MSARSEISQLLVEQLDVIDPPERVTDPGVYPSLPHLVYHSQADALSSTGARNLLPPSTPAAFDWWRTHPEPRKLVFDLGNATHDTLLGGGPQIVVVDAPDWRKKADREFAKETLERGAVPILAHQKAAVDAMVAAVRSHPVAGKLFSDGRPEVSLFWRDDRADIMRRARLDWFPQPKGGRMVIPDLKTCESAHPDKFARSAAAYGYHCQARYYLDGVQALDLADEDAVLLFVAVEKAPPHLVNVIQLDVIAMRAGAALNRKAIDTFAQCQAANTWPGYSLEPDVVSLPAWAERAAEETA